MSNTSVNAAHSTEAEMFREEAARARRYAAAAVDRAVIGRLGEIADLYEELAAGQDPGPTDRD